MNTGGAKLGRTNAIPAMMPLPFLARKTQMLFLPHLCAYEEKNIFVL